MRTAYSVYCDESCHLEFDQQKSMVLGALWATTEASIEASRRVKEIKLKHGISAMQEIKWTKITPSKTELYTDLVDYFFDNKELHFRGLIVPDKAVLDHAKHNQTHDEWYYKMYFYLLTTILSNSSRYSIYLDIKDTLGGEKIERLKDVLANDRYDFERKAVEKIQLVRSHEVQLVQLADVLIGALMYKHRGEHLSVAKRSVMERIAERSGYSLMRNTLYTENKFNLFIWKGGHIEL